MNKWTAYWRNWWLFLRGFRWLWTRQISRWVEIDTHAPPIWVPQARFQSQNPDRIILNTDELIRYKPGWTPLKFCLLVYWWDYGLATLLGRGVQSLSRAFQLFGQRHHWGHTGPILWGSKDLWL